ncbi:MAG TPA: hypothetical protein VMN79_17885 [Casimicrobiaceae bacterium]|nr:hypothetical protein [Casimicrobiaceae bacterium]
MREPRSPPLAAASVCLVASCCFLAAACTPMVYKDDIATFGRGVDDAATAFDALHAKALAKYRSLQFEEFAENEDVITVSRDCTKSVTEGQLAKDTSCLAGWAAYRAAAEATRGPKPACPGASESVRGGDYVFYDLAALGEKEALTCSIGIRRRDGIDTAAIDDAEVLLTNAPKLLPALKGYAAALAGIADAADRTALLESVGKAKDQITRLGTRIDGLDGKTSPYVSTIGPVADLVGTALVAILEQRRYRALVEVTAGADPVVTRAAIILSNVAMPMTALELQDAGLAYLGSFPDPGKPARDEDAWAAAYGKTRAARERYLSLFATSPTPVFKALADAHHELTLALGDPRRQYESVAAAVSDFADKARAAHDAVEKARAGGANAK